jgi:hypothetical protein
MFFLIENFQTIVGNTSKSGASAAEQIFLISFGHTPAPTRQLSQGQDHGHHIELACPVNS